MQHFKIYYIGLLFIIVLTSCYHKKSSAVKSNTDASLSIETSDCSTSINYGINKKANLLNEYYNNLKNISEGEKQRLEYLFFCVFPSSYKEMDLLFGVDYNTGKGPLYDNGMPIIEYFNQLTTVPKYIYYEKFINICVNGIWQADNMDGGFGFKQKLLNDTKECCKQLSKRTDEEIKSVFYYLFDEPHPNNQYSKKTYYKVEEAIAQEDERLLSLLQKAYNELISENHSH